MERYVYEPLRSPRSFRLLSIWPDADDAPLHVQLNETQLDNSPTYTALSYVWGTSEARQDLFICDCNPKIRKNAYSLSRWFRREGREAEHSCVYTRFLKIRDNVLNALRWFRKNGIRKVWIDAVCINQEDLDERAAQVTIMRQIYDSAELAVVYLDQAPSSAESEGGLLGELLLSVQDFGSRHNHGSNPSAHVVINWTDVAQHGLPEFHDPQWQKLIPMLHHPWFSRAWVFQEVLVARECHFVYDSLEIDSELLFSALDILKYFDLPQHFVLAPDQDLRTIDNSIRRSWSIMKLKAPQGTLRGPVWTRCPLIHHLRADLNSKATDPRDKVFAMLGVSDEFEEPHLQPDYHKSATEICVSVAETMISRGHGPLVINSTAAKGPEPGVPSWVPLWHSRNFVQILPKVAFPGEKDYETFQVTDGAEPVFQLRTKGGILTVQGTILDRIHKFGTSELLSRLATDDGNRDNRMNAILVYLVEIADMLQTATQSCPEGRPRLEAISRMAVCDRRHLLNEKAPEGYHIGARELVRISGRAQLASGDYDSLCDALKIGKQSRNSPRPPNNAMAAKWASEVGSAALEAMKIAVRFLTRQGYLGQCLPRAEIGDAIALIAGCEIPYLLRPLEDGRYSLVGDCYVHGIMYGEAWDAAKVQDIEIA
ncbi:MAG: hypothetical protein Q9160_005959 [Pyrenula sp. 1 TL-2023]